MVRLIPSDPVFFDMLDDLAVRVTTGSSLLEDLFENPDQRGPLVRLIREEEHSADKLTHDIVCRLGTSFVPPLDPTEIYELARALDATIDIVEDAASRVEAFRMDSVDAPTLQLAMIVHRSAGVIETAVAKLRDANSLLEGISEAWRLEEEGDAIYSQAMEQLFSEPGHPIDVLKRKELYDVLEDAIDLSKDVAEVLTSIAVKRT